jgi:NTE family protein
VIPGATNRYTGSSHPGCKGCFGSPFSFRRTKPPEQRAVGSTIPAMRTPIVFAFIAACVALLTLLSSTPVQAADTPPGPSVSTSGAAVLAPRIGLVLSGGGARGLAHVGVLKVLERERIPIHAIVGTSMGAIIGGLYASGMRADEIERELLKLNWDEVFAPRVERRQLSHRRKEEDFAISPVLEFGMRDGQFKAPLGALSGRGLESLLRRFSLPVRDVVEFDALPIPFRAVATDMESGRAVVLASGDLALALRASMSIPGLFAPTEVQGRLLGDGGLVNNLPVEVARQMGVDIVIAVNVGTPLSARSSLGSAAGLTAQMINILTEQNVRRGLDALTPRDVLITPVLGELGASDFGPTRELIDFGAAAATAAVQQRLSELAVSYEAHNAWRARQERPAQPTAVLRFVRFEGSTQTNPQRFARRLESAAGQPFDPERAERDARQLAASGDYVRADYRLVKTRDGDGLVFDLEDKPWGPHYFRVGLDLSTNFAGQSAFNVKISHNRHWLDAHGTEWRNQLQIGAVPRWASELYRPLNWTHGILDDGFVAAYGELERRELAVYNNQSGRQRGRFNRGLVRSGVDLGQPWGQGGEVRLGVTYGVLRTTPDILAADYTGPREAFTTREGGVRLRAVVDQLDFATFPQHGYRVETEFTVGQRSGTVREPFRRLEVQASSVGTWSGHTVDASARLQYAGQGDFGSVGRYSLGGFQQLSGYEPGQIDGNYLLFGRLIYTHRLDESPVFTRGWFGGATLEAGNAWDRRADAHVSDLRLGASAFIGAATALGPLYFGVTYAPKGSAGLSLVIGRP